MFYIYAKIIFDGYFPPAHSKEGRPRNLGRGVSKPKKNTVASLLAQSRALGIKPILSQQYSAEDLVRNVYSLSEPYIICQHYEFIFKFSGKTEASFR